MGVVRMALVVGLKVVNVILYDTDLPEEKQYKPPHNHFLVECNSPVSVGDWYLDGTFVSSHFTDIDVSPKPATVGQEIAIAVSLPEGSPDQEVIFSVPGALDVTEPVVDGKATTTIMVEFPGTLEIVVKSEHHGPQIAEVEINEP